MHPDAQTKLGLQVNLKPNSGSKEGATDNGQRNGAGGAAKRLCKTIMKKGHQAAAAAATTNAIAT